MGGGMGISAVNHDDRPGDLDHPASSALVRGDWPIPEPKHWYVFRHALEADAPAFGVVTHRRFFEPYSWCMADDVCDGVASSEPVPVRHRPFPAGDGPGCGQKRYAFLCGCWRESPDYDRFWDSIHAAGSDPDAFAIPIVRMMPGTYKRLVLGPGPSDRSFTSVTVWIGQCPECWTIYWAAEELRAT